MGYRHSYQRFTIFIFVFCFYAVFSCFRKGTTIYSNKRIQRIDGGTISEYKKQSHQRHRFLKNYVKGLGYGALYNALVPEVFCIDLIRIGRVGDGGKWVCNPTSMLKWPRCTIYSLGIDNNPHFEEDFQKFLNNKCKLRSIDKDDQSPLTNERIKNSNGVFKKAFISAQTNQDVDEYKLSTVLSEFGDKRIDILKIDIEGGEFGIINELISTPICQILIEVHGKTAEETFKLLQALSENGFYLFSYEVNGFRPEFSEYSFIHKNCLSVFNVRIVYGKYLS